MTSRSAASMIAHRLLRACALAGVLACSNEELTMPGGWISGQAVRAIANGVWQHVAVIPEAESRADTFIVRSVIHNRRHTPYTAIIGGCSITIQTTLESRPHPEEVLCRALPRQTDIAPGDSVVFVARRVTDANPGLYEVRVLHVYDPERWITVPVVRR